MGLPVIETPVYDVIVPSTQKKIKFRPFLVKEQKILLIALDSDDTQEINRAIKEIVDSCTFNKLNVDTLPAFDSDYLFMKIRSKSVGEEIELSIKCSACEEPNDYSMNIDDLSVIRNENHTNKIQLTDTVGIVMRYPTMDEISNLRANYNIETISNIIAACIETIYDAEEIYKSSDSSIQERVEWLEQLNQEQYDKLEQFFNTAPYLNTSIEFDCKKCNHHNNILVEGIADFFG